MSQRAGIFSAGYGLRGFCMPLNQRDSGNSEKNPYKIKIGTDIALSRGNYGFVSKIIKFSA